MSLDEQFDLAAYITGANTDFNYLQSPCHSESDTYDYVDRWLNDCLKEDIPTESIEAIVWSKQECDLNVLVSFYLFCLYLCFFFPNILAITG